MSRIDDAARDIAARARDRAIDTVAAAIEGTVPDATVSTEPDRVVIAGRGLVRRWTRDAALRWIKGLLR
jgi:hypothetical protein